MKCDIIMPVWNKRELTEQCLESIFKHTYSDYHIIIIDNGSDEPAAGYLRALKSSRPDKITLLRSEENLGYTKAVNRGIAVSRAGYVCILNNDIIVFDGWLGEMIRIAESRKDIGIVNPSNNFGKKKPWNKTYSQYAREMTAGEKGRYSQTSAPVGFCYLVKRELIDKIGALDERFSPGYFEDTDYAIRAGRAGYKSVFAKGAFVFHFEHSSFKKRGFNSFFKKSEEKFYRIYKRPERFLYILRGADKKHYARIKQESFDLVNECGWVTIFLKKSAPQIDLCDHTQIRMFRLPGIFFAFNAIIKILVKKKKFSKIFVDDKRLLKRLNALKKYHKAQVELMR